MQVNFNKRDASTNFTARTEFAKFMKPEFVEKIPSAVAKVFNEILAKEKLFQELGDDFTKIVIEPGKDSLLTKVSYNKPLFKTVQVQDVTPPGFLKKLAIKLKLWSPPSVKEEVRPVEAYNSLAFYSYNKDTFGCVFRSIKEDIDNVKVKRQLQKTLVDKNIYKETKVKSDNL
jgi:hypothetical protein